MHRRHFVHQLSAGLAGSALGLPLVGIHSPLPAPSGYGPVTVADIMNRFISETGAGSIPGTVDTLKAGTKDQVVTGVISCMFATIDIIREAIARKANFIIAHEPSFYNHQDDTDWLQQDPVYQFKKALLDKHRIAVWRNHDYIHSHQPDGIYAGTLNKLGWKPVTEQEPWLLQLPAKSADELIHHCKTRLNIPFVRFLRDRTASCSRISLALGAAGGRSQIEQVRKDNPDLVLVGELSEWELLEYMRDRKAAGMAAGLLILGHIPSEQEGMQWMAEWVTRQYPGLGVWYLATTQPLQYL